MDDKRIATAMVDPTDLFQRAVAQIVKAETDLSFPKTSDLTDLEVQRRKELLAAFDGVEQVDLVGHSTPIYRYLKLGNWVLDPAGAERLASYMPSSVKTVRLIGCCTASTDTARAAVQALTRSGISGCGTINKVYTTHFDSNGVKRGDGEPPLKVFGPSGSLGPASPSPVQPAAKPPSPPVPASPAQPAAAPPQAVPPSPASPAISSSPAQPVVKPAAPPVCVTYAPGIVATHHAHVAVPRWLAWLGRIAWSVIAVPVAWFRWLLLRLLATDKVPHWQILSLLSPRSSVMPGLLTEPLFVFEITSGQKTWILEILFDFELARFYAKDDHETTRERVYEIRRGFARIAKTLLEDYLELVRHGVKLLHRHEEAGDRCGRHRQVGGQDAAGDRGAAGG